MKLLTVEDARSRMLAAVTTTGCESIGLAAALGRVLARDVRASRDQPPFAASAMDGWAVHSADCPGRLRIAGESAAGRAYAGRLAAGEAVRIFTGAPVPAGADAVVIQEDATADDAHVSVPAVSEPRHIRPAGQDFTAGTLLLAPGVRLDAWRLSLAAAAGRPTLEVAKRPQVVILSTGEEIVAPGGSPGPYQIFNSGTTALAALVDGWGGRADPLAEVGDSIEAIAAAIAEAGGDLIVTIGGASVGDHDLVKPALRTLGLEMIVESVAVRPGKPTWFGALADGRRVLGLPGNPASALVCAELFLRPLLFALQGADPVIRLIAAKTTAPLPENGLREHWMRTRLSHEANGVIAATPFDDQDSALVTVFAQADALLRRTARAPAAAAGDAVDVLPLRRFV
jgi:molybdopterin molybdotransferase